MRRIVNQRWNLLHEDERLKKVFKNRPIIAYRKPKNLKDLLVRSKFVYEQEEDLFTDLCISTQIIKISDRLVHASMLSHS